VEVLGIFVALNKMPLAKEYVEILGTFSGTQQETSG
jgi:hypothetical protein